MIDNKHINSHTNSQTNSPTTVLVTEETHAPTQAMRPRLHSFQQKLKMYGFDISDVSLVSKLLISLYVYIYLSVCLCVVFVRYVCSFVCSHRNFISISYNRQIMRWMIF